MKRISFGLMFVALMSIVGCAPNRFYLVNSEGIFSYNRHTGQLEFMWETKTAPAVSDSLSSPQMIESRK